MEEHDLFFQRIIGLIPRELYNAKEDDDSLNTRYFKHRIQPLEASERKLLSKKRKLEKYGGAAEGDNEEEDDENDDEDDDVDEDDEDDSEQDDDEQDAENDEEENEKPVPMKVVDNSNLSSDPKVRLRVSLALLKIGNGLRSELISSIDAS
jgi:hypothetical protein